jgi:hypothetical protein
MTRRSATKFDINRFRADISNRGVLRNNQFDVSINLPSSHYLSGRYRDTDLVSIRCEAASIPGMSLSTIDGQPKYGYGPVETFPYSVMYDQINLTFLLDKNSFLHKFFYDWISCIVNFDNSKGLDAAISHGSEVFKTYEVGYKSQYQSQLVLNVYNEANQRVQKVTMLRAFPKAINQIDVGWENTDSVMKLMIPFTFREFTIDYSRYEGVSRTPPRPTVPETDAPRGNIAPQNQTSPQMNRTQSPTTTTGPTVFGRPTS